MSVVKICLEEEIEDLSLQIHRKIFIYDDNDMNSEPISDMIDFGYKEFVKEQR